MSASVVSDSTRIEYLTIQKTTLFSIRKIFDLVCLGLPAAFNPGGC